MSRLRFWLLAEQDGEEVGRALVEPDEEQSAELLRRVQTRTRTRQLERVARIFVEQRPDASATAFYRTVKGRKQDALRAFAAAKKATPVSVGGVRGGERPATPGSRVRDRLTRGAAATFGGDRHRRFAAGIAELARLEDLGVDVADLRARVVRVYRCGEVSA